MFYPWIILTGKFVQSHFIQRHLWKTFICWLIFLLIKEHPCRVLSLLLQLHTFWVESDNYFTVTKPWFASRIPFPLSLILPGRMSKGALTRILLTRGVPPLYHLQEVEAQVRSWLISEPGPSWGGTREISRDELICGCLPNKEF